MTALTPRAALADEIARAAVDGAKEGSTAFVVVPPMVHLWGMANPTKWTKAISYARGFLEPVIDVPIASMRVMDGQNAR